MTSEMLYFRSHCQCVLLRCTLEYIYLRAFTREDRCLLFSDCEHEKANENSGRLSRATVLKLFLPHKGAYYHSVNKTYPQNTAFWAICLTSHRNKSTMQLTLFNRRAAHFYLQSTRSHLHLPRSLDAVAFLTCTMRCFCRCCACSLWKHCHWR